MRKFLLAAATTLLTGGVAQAHCPQPCQYDVCNRYSEEVGNVQEIGGVDVVVPIPGIPGVTYGYGPERRWDRRYDRYDRRWDRRFDRDERRWDRRYDRWDRRW